MPRNQSSIQFPLLFELSPSCGSCKVVETGWCAAVEKPQEEEEQEEEEKREEFRVGVDVFRLLCCSLRLKGSLFCLCVGGGE